MRNCKVLTIGHFFMGTPCLNGIKYLDPLFYHDISHTKLYVCAKFVGDWRFERYRLQHGSTWFPHGHTPKQTMTTTVVAKTT